MPEISHQHESHQPDSGGDEDIVTDRTTVWKSNETENEKQEREKKRERIVSHLYSLVRIGWSVLSLAPLRLSSGMNSISLFTSDSVKHAKARREKRSRFMCGLTAGETYELKTVHTLTGAHVRQMSHTSALLFCIYGAFLLKWI